MFRNLGSRYWRLVDLRRFLITMVLGSILGGWLTRDELVKGRAIRAIIAVGGIVTDEGEMWEVDPNGWRWQTLFREVDQVQIRGHVTTADITQIAAFNHLRRLTLGDVTDASDDFDRLGSQPELKQLTILGPGLRAEQVARIARWTALESLWIGPSSLADADLAPLQALKRLTALTIGESPRMTWAGPPDLVANLTKLRFLDLSGTAVNDHLLQVVPLLPALEVLHLDRTRVGDGGMHWIGAAARLRSLHLSETSVGDLGLEVVGRLPELRSLALRDCSITGSGLIYLAGSQHLEDLDLSGTTVNDRTIAGLGLAPSLETLDVSWTQVTDAACPALARLARLRDLNLDETMVGDPGLSLLGRIDHLNDLSLIATPATTEGVVALLATRISLRSVRWGDRRRVAAHKPPTSRPMPSPGAPIAEP